MKSKKLNQAQIAEVRDLYDGSSASVRYLSKLFKVGITCISWIVNYKDYRKKHSATMRNWRKANPRKNKLLNKKAYKKYSQTDEFKKQRKRYYWKNRKKLLAYNRLRYKRFKKFKKVVIKNKKLLKL